MAYSTGVATSQQDLLNQLSTFAVANGWTQDYFDTTNKWFGLHKGTVFVQYRWDAVASTGSIGVYQSLSFTSTGTQPGAHGNDSGSGVTGTGAVTTGRRISNIGNGPFTSHFFFTDAGSTYIHCVLEYAPGQYRHFGFGTIAKEGSWTGGEYVNGHVWSTTNPNQGSVSAQGDSGHFPPFDNGGQSTTGSKLSNTIHIESMPGQAASGKWAAFASQSNTLNGNDTAGIARAGVMGGMRNNYLCQAVGWLRASLINGYIPLIPLPVIYLVNTAPIDWYPIGFAPDIRMIQMANINPAAEFTVGADTWKVFPLVRKANLQNNQEESRNCGIAYKKIP